MSTDRILTSLNDHEIDIKSFYSKVKDESNDITEELEFLTTDLKLSSSEILKTIKKLMGSNPEYFL